MAAAPATGPFPTFETIIGQDRALGTLRSAIAAGRLHHAWVFHGPAGVGKFSAARAFGALVLDPDGAGTLGSNRGLDPDGPVQRLIRSGAHSDFHVVTKELAANSRNPKVREGKQITLAKDVIDEFVIEPAHKTRTLTWERPSLAGKVFIIDEAELMDQRTQNVLLKTLEEPPAGTLFVLVTSSEDRLLPTIRSRTQRVGFSPLDDSGMRSFVSARSDIAWPGGDDLDWVLRFAAGSPGLACTAVDCGLIAWRTALSGMLDEAARGRFSPDLGPTMYKLVEERAAAVVKANPDASKDGANKAWARRMLAFIAEDARARLRSQARAGKVTAEDATGERLIGVIEAVHAAEGHLVANVNLGLVFDHLAARMSGQPALV